MSDLEKVLHEYTAHGTVTSTCAECDHEITTEPDATTAYCAHCDDVLPVNNPLIDHGMI